MTNILELLKNEKVEWKKLSDLCTRQKGIKITAKQMRELNQENGAVKIFAGGNTVAYVDVNNIKKENIIDKPSIIIKSRGNIDFEYYDNLFTHKNELWSYSIRSNDNIKFVYYFMKQNIEYFKNRSISGKLPQISTGLTDNFLIPIPSLETQEKIVEILDKFTNYVKELQSELQSRTKQYTYYRDKLLSEEYLTKVTKEMEEDRKVNTLRLEEVCEFERGKRLVKSELQEEGEFPVYQNSIIPLGYYHEKNFERDNTFIISAGAAGEIVYSDREFWAADDVYVLKTKENITSKYLYYLLLSKQYIIKSKVRKASIPRLSKDDIEKILVDIPPLSLQNKIVKVLDEFQVLLSVTKGLLPTEIEQRQKQYEYYREKLLTFGEVSDRFDSIRFITSLYYDILQEAANIVKVDIEDKLDNTKLLNSAKVTKLAGYEFTKYVKYEEKGEIIALRGLNVKKGKIILDNVKYIDNSDFSKLNRSKLIKNDILFTYVGTIGEVGLIEENNKYYLAPNVALIRVDQEKISPRYMIHLLQSNNFKNREIEKRLKSSSMKNLTMENIREFSLILPPLHVQQHIVNILDKFDTLVNDLKVGLPREIEQRQKQYEYWRECLLNFPR